MITYHCPHCHNSMYSAAEHRDKPYLECIHCQGEVPNRFYEGVKEDVRNHRTHRGQ